MRNVLVTGASTGIGHATATLLAARGFGVFAGVRGEVDFAPGITSVTLDVTNADQVAALRELPIDALVNNAGIAVTGPLEFMPLDELRRQLEVNTIGQLAVTQACLPSLHRSHGRIVNVSSIAGRVALPLFGPYAASKFALEALSDSLRRELDDVHVSLVEPGAIATPIWERSLAAADALWEAMPGEAHTRYGALVATMRAIAAKQGVEGTPVEAVATTVLEALTARRPRSRYVVGREAKVQAALARALPGRALDFVLARALAR